MEKESKYEKILTSEHHMLIKERKTNKYIIANKYKINRKKLYSVKINKITPEMIGQLRQKMEKYDKMYERYTNKYVEYDPEKKSKELISIFKEDLPHNGFYYRKTQVKTGLIMLHSGIQGRHCICEAEVGTGKTFAYLIASILFKKYSSINNYFYDEYTGVNTRKTIVISTSSISLQNQLMGDIKRLSAILLNCGIIKKPLTAIIRKGKEHYICDKKLATLLDKKNTSEYRYLTEKNEDIDLDNHKEIKNDIKMKIKVKSCSNSCLYVHKCRYKSFYNKNFEENYDFQICNHNYFLADLKAKNRKNKPLLPQYQLAIIDEAHKLEDVSRDMFGDKLEYKEIHNIMEKSSNFLSNREDYYEVVGTLKEIQDINDEIFQKLKDNVIIENEEDEEDIIRYQTLVDGLMIATLKQLKNKMLEIKEYLDITNTWKNNSKGSSELFHKTESIISAIDFFIKRPSNFIYWLENKDNDNVVFKFIPKDLSSQLYKQLFNNEFPVILTSGTLSVQESFDYYKKSIGLNKTKEINEISVKSPFDFKENCIMYIPENMIYPDPKNSDYINYLINEIEQLIEITNGNALILFTAYKVLEQVFDGVKKKKKYHYIKASKRNTHLVSEFKDNKNSVMFATGSMWEGIDIPGDNLSSLIIVKLPFPIPDPIYKYRQTLYSNHAEYYDKELFPAMVVKLKQGIGRLIRNELDTGCISILDSRINKPRFREKVITSLPDCNITSDLEEIKQFLIKKKDTSYFENNN